MISWIKKKCSTIHSKEYIRLKEVTRDTFVWAESKLRQNQELNIIEALDQGTELLSKHNNIDIQYLRFIIHKFCRKDECRKSYVELYGEEGVCFIKRIRLDLETEKSLDEGTLDEGSLSYESKYYIKEYKLDVLKAIVSKGIVITTFATIVAGIINIFFCNS